jgi:hypothetical protein
MRSLFKTSFGYIGLLLLVAWFCGASAAQDAWNFDKPVSWDKGLPIGRVFRQSGGPIRLYLKKPVDSFEFIAVDEAPFFADTVALCPAGHGNGNVWFFSGRIPVANDAQALQVADKTYTFVSILLVLTHRAPVTSFEQVMTSFTFLARNPQDSTWTPWRSFVLRRHKGQPRLPRIDRRSPYESVVTINEPAGEYLFADAPRLYNVKSGMTIARGKTPTSPM